MAEEDKPKKDKKKEDKLKFAKDTTDASICAASRLSKCLAGNPDGPSWQDSVALVYVIGVHVFGLVMAFVTAYHFWAGTEKLENPFEPIAYSNMSGALDAAVTSGTELNTTTKAGKEAFKHCVTMYNDNRFVHLCLLGVLVGGFVGKLHDICWRLYIVWTLPGGGKSEDDTLSGITEEDDDGNTVRKYPPKPDDDEINKGITKYSPKNSQKGAAHIDHMHHGAKICAFVFVLLPHLVWCIFMIWVSIKSVVFTFDIVKLLKAALKIKIVDKFSKATYCTLPQDLIAYFDDGQYVWQKVEDKETFGWRYSWQAWGSVLSKLIMGVTFPVIVYFYIFKNVPEYQSLCRKYVGVHPNSSYAFTMESAQLTWKERYF